MMHLLQHAKVVRQKGFTVVELLVVIVATGLIMGLVFNFFWQYWQYAEKSQSDLDAFTARLDISDYIRENVGTSSGLITQNSITDPNANVPDAVAGANYWETVHPVPGTKNTNTAQDQSLLYYKRFSQDNTKNFIFNGTNPYEDEFVMYLNRSGEIRVRTLANSNAAGNGQTTSCPPEIATTTCPADKFLIGDVSSVAVRYFSRSGNLLDYTPVYDPVLDSFVYGPDFPSVEVIEYTINIAKKAFTQTSDTTKSSTIIRIAIRNQ